MAARKKRVVISKHLIDNSKYALLSAIEIHNKPIFPYRYEICTLLIINARELLMKAYIYKKMGNKKITQKDKNTWYYISFDACLWMVSADIKKDFDPIRENLKLVYWYRNNVVHSYWIEYGSILNSLLSKNVIFYKEFYEKYFSPNLINENDLILLPIGFEKFISPIEFLSNESNYNTAPKEVQEFIKNIIVSIRSLHEKWINESILGNFKISFEHTNNVKNADFVARLDKNAPIILDKSKKIRLSEDEKFPMVRFETYEEEKRFQNENYPLTNAELRKKIREKYLYKLRSWIFTEVKKYQKNPQYCYVCRWETQRKYAETLIDIIWKGFPDNPRLEHLKDKK